MPKNQTGENPFGTGYLEKGLHLAILGKGIFSPLPGRFCHNPNPSPASGGPPGAPTRRAPGGGAPWTPYMHGHGYVFSLSLLSNCKSTKCVKKQFECKQQHENSIKAVRIGGQGGASPLPAGRPLGEPPEANSELSLN